MADFKVRSGLSTQLFSAPGVVNPKVVIEEGCWYLCTDTASLYYGTKENNEPLLKLINGQDIERTLYKLDEVQPIVTDKEYYSAVAINIMLQKLKTYIDLGDLAKPSWITTISEDSTDDEIPTAKAVYTFFASLLGIPIDFPVEVWEDFPENSRVEGD